MKLLLLAEPSAVRDLVVEALESKGEVTTVPLAGGDLGDGRRLDTLATEGLAENLKGFDTLFFMPVLGLPGELDDAELLDLLVRGAYQLGLAAPEAGVTRFVIGSSMVVMGEYPAELAVDEWYRPQPKAQMPDLAYRLAEMVCYQVAMEKELKSVALRFGEIVDGEAVAGQPFNPQWVDLRDVLPAIAGAAEFESHRGPWQIVHVVSPDGRSRWPLSYTITRTVRAQPSYPFPQCPSEVPA